MTSPRDAKPAWAAPGPALRIDALGKKCPLPIIMLAQRIGEIPIGTVVEVLADDPATKTDVPAWCGLKSHEFLGAADLATTSGWAYRVRRSY
ncbi:MAG TPA: sulfurtransferase TusA family protein [Streptosporangiaceae bacterium]|nr:sulfurtransferase TusA family protein [Streptosporangiaceae bacterium]